MINEKMGLLESKLVSVEKERYVKAVQTDLINLRTHLGISLEGISTADKEEVAKWVYSILYFDEGLGIRFPAVNKLPKAVEQYCKFKAINEFLTKFDTMKETIEYLEEAIE